MVIIFAFAPDIAISEDTTFVRKHFKNYFLTNNALPNNEGELFFRNDMIVFNGLNYAFTEEFSMMVSFPVISLSDVEIINTGTINLLRKFPIEKDLSTATSMTITGFLSNDMIFNLSQILTYGDNYNNGTFGFGYTRSMGNHYTLLADNIYIKAAGAVRLNEYFSLISENYIFFGINSQENARIYGDPIPTFIRNDIDFMASLGVRGFYDNGSLDLAYVINPDYLTQSLAPFLFYLKFQYYFNY